MPITTVIFLAGVIIYFAAFAAVLAWGEHQTRNIGREADKLAGTRAQVQSLKDAADRSRVRVAANAS